MATATISKNGKSRIPASVSPNGEPVQNVAVIAPPRFREVTFELVGQSPYMQLKFSQKTQNKIREKQEQGQTAKKGKAREARDFKSEFEAAKHVSDKGWCGIPAAAFRAACIDVCRMVDFHMTRAKMSIFILADGYDKEDATALVRIFGADPEMNFGPVRNATGVVDLRARPVWKEWKVFLKVRFDEDQFRLDDVANLISRAGVQCGVGEGRPFSKNSNGLGYGTWKIEGAPK
jgi:hypothetical protein